MAQYKKVGNLKVRTDLSPEKQALVNEIAKNYVKQNKAIDSERRKNIGRGVAGSLVSGASFLPFLNIPGAGAALGGAMFDLGQGIAEGDKAKDLAIRTIRGGAIGAAIPPAARKLAATKAGQAVGKQLEKAAEKFAQTKAYDTLMTDIRAFNPNKQIAYHGSPYDFNKFSNEAIGTGEGAQAHGYGHYAALDKNVANGYRWQLNADTSNGYYPILYKGERVPTNTKEGQLISQIVDNYKKYGLKDYAEGKEEIIEPFKNLINKPIKGLEHLTETAKRDLPIVENINPNDIKEWEGQLYKLSIPKKDVMLREGAIFAEQPKAVQKAIKEIIKENPDLSDFINTKTKEELFDITEKATGKNGKKIMKEIFDAELSGDENKIIAAWDKWNNFEAQNNTYDSFDPNIIYGYLDNYKGNNLDDVDRIFTKKYSNTNIYNLIEDERNFNKALSDKGIKGISYNGGIDGEAAVIFNPDDIDIVRKFYNQEQAIDHLNKMKPNTGAVADAFNDMISKAEKKQWKQYAKNNLIGNSVDVPNYTTVNFTNKNFGEDYVYNMPEYKNLLDNLKNSQYQFSTNYKNEADRLYDHLTKEDKDRLFDYLIEVIQEPNGNIHHNYKMMKNITRGDLP